jgi:O-methyltransferase
MSKQALVNLYSKLPLPISKYVYAMARRTFFLDARMAYFDSIFASISSNKVDGDYLEFGVFRGTSFIMAHNLSKRYALNAMRFFAFDSFEGLPNSEGMVFTKGEFACSEELFRTMVRKSGVDLHNVFTVKGFYSDSLNEKTKQKYQMQKAAIVHIDCDLYTSTKAVLKFIESLIVPGTILIFDDWDAFKDEDVENMGERKAFKEWTMYECFDNFVDFGGCGRAFVMARRAS